MSSVSVRDLIGCPYKIHGRSKEEGFDCYGVDIEVYKRHGRYLPDIGYDSPEEYENVYLSVLHKVKYTKVDRPEELSLIMISLKGEPRHTGVYLGNGLFIHATRNLGVIVEPLHRWANRVVGYYNVSECKDNQESV